MTNKETPEITEEQKQAALMIEVLSNDILEKLKAGENDVDIQLLMDAIEAYAAFPNFDAEEVKKWKARISEITKHLEKQYQQVQAELSDLVEKNPHLVESKKED